MFHDLIFGTMQDVVCYHLGVTFLKLVTNGKYPPEPVSDVDRRKVEVVGLVISVCLILGIVYVVSGLL